MNTIFTFIESLPAETKALLVGVVLRCVTQIVKRTVLKGVLKRLKVNPAKAAKLITVGLLAGLATALQAYSLGHGWSWMVGTWLAYTASAVFVHEAWQKLVVAWFGRIR